MRILFLSSFIFALSACKTGHLFKKKELYTPQYVAGPQALIYKTKKDYSNFVPVFLSDDKSEIISYPMPSDLYVDGKLALPSKLKKDYLLDNKGIGRNVAFLNLTYQEYAALKTVPSLKELYELIQDKDPLIELCDCGNKTKLTDPEKQLNLLISKDELTKRCKIVKLD
jgi:hypothetical protein